MEAMEPDNDAATVASQPVVAGPVVAGPVVADVWSAPPLQPGQFTPGWRTVFIVGWVAVLASFGAVWYACRVAGIAPWWLGPSTDLRPLYIRLLPFVVPALVVVVATLGSRFSVYVGLAGAVASGAIALGDVARYPGIAAAEATIAMAALLISVAGLGGRMRHPAADGPAPGPPAPDGPTPAPPAGNSPEPA